MNKKFTVAFLPLIFSVFLSACTKTPPAPINQNSLQTQADKINEANEANQWKKPYTNLTPAYEQATGDATLFIATKKIETKSSDGQVTTEEKMGLVDTSGKILIPFEYKIIGRWTGYIGSFFYAAKKDGAVGVLDRDGKVIIEPIYQSVRYYLEGYQAFLVKNKDKFGIVSLKNKVLLPIIYDKINIKSDIVIATKNEKTGLFFGTGQLIVKPIYDTIEFSNDSTGTWRRGAQCGNFTINSGKFAELLAHPC